MPIAYSYVRFSTPEQLKGDSLRRQLKLSEEYAREHNLTLDTSLKLRDLGLSAFHGHHIEKGALGAFLRAVESGRVTPGSYLLVESIDRLSRAKVSVALQLFTGILNAGITIVTLLDRQVYSREGVDKDWTSLLSSIVYMARAWEESETKRKRLLAAWQEKISEARAGGKKVTKTCPAWMTLSADRRSFILIPEKVAVIKRIFQLAREGMGTYVMERKFNLEGIPPIGTTRGWHKTYLLCILTNRAVIGEYQYFTGKGKNRKPSGEPIPDYFPRIVSEEDFYAVQKILTEKRPTATGRKGIGVPNLLTGLCKCGYCGATMSYIDKGRFDSQRFLVCASAKRGLECRYTAWKYSEVERVVLNLITDLQIEDLSSNEMISIGQELMAAKGRLDQLIKAQSNLLTAIEQAPDVTVLVGRLREIEAQLVDTKEQERKLTALQLSGLTVEQQLKGLKELRNKLSLVNGDDLYRLRTRIVSELKQIIARVRFFPRGVDPEVKLPDADFPSDFLEFHSLGKGFEHRYMVLDFKSGKKQYFFVGAIERNEGIERLGVDGPFGDDDGDSAANRF